MKIIENRICNACNALLLELLVDPFCCSLVLHLLLSHTKNEFSASQHERDGRYWGALSSQAYPVILQNFQRGKLLSTRVASSQSLGSATELGRIMSSFHSRALRN